MRRIIFLAVMLVLALAVNAFADVLLFRGQAGIGAVQTIDNTSGSFVPVEDVGRLLGFRSSRSGDELVLNRGSSQIRVIEKSAAAWRGMSIVALHTAPFERNGKLWLDTQSVISLFQTFMGNGQNNRLRFLTNQEASAQKAAQDKKDAAQSKPQPQVIASEPEPEPETPKTPEPQQQVTASQTPEENQDQEVQAESSHPVKPKKKQPRVETFRPGVSKSERAEYYSGTIQRIRWSRTEGLKNKIIAMVDADDEADPQVFLSGNSLHALFEGCADNAEGLTSPYDEVKTELKPNDKGVELIFTLTDFTKAEKLVLNDPRRIAFDFLFPEEAESKSEDSSSPEPQESEPKQEEEPKEEPKDSEPQEAQTLRQPPAIPEAPKDSTTPRSLSPAVTTPPSTITIPMTPGGVRLKKVVLDPGHGGKDPGASDNGVMEKDINLAVGLELERALTARGVKVVMTRNTDVYLTLQERTDVANRENADLFVSIHVNALPNKKSMAGFEIYIMALPTDKDAMNLAKVENREYVEGKGMDVANVDRRTEMLLKILGDMQQNNKISESMDFAAALYNAGLMNDLPMRRIAQAPFFVLRGAGMPAVLLEIGFVTNAAESALLATQNYQQKIANAMAVGIMNYLR